MSTQLFRSYIDIINENSQETILTEGLVDTLTAKAKSWINKVPQETLQKVIGLVSNALGKPADSLSLKDVTLANAKKVIAANQQLAEADQNVKYDNYNIAHGGEGYQTAEIPGSLAANQAKNAKVYGILGALIGGFQGAFMQDHTFSNVGLPIILGAAILAIIFAVIARASSSADRGNTGKYRDAAGRETQVTRDPRLGPQ